MPILGEVGPNALMDAFPSLVRLFPTPAQAGANGEWLRADSPFLLLLLFFIGCFAFSSIGGFMRSGGLVRCRGPSHPSPSVACRMRSGNNALLRTVVHYTVPLIHGRDPRRLSQQRAQWASLVVTTQEAMRHARDKVCMYVTTAKPSAIAFFPDIGWRANHPQPFFPTSLESGERRAWSMAPSDGAARDITKPNSGTQSYESRKRSLHIHGHETM